MMFQRKLCLSSDGANVNKAIWSAIIKVLLDQGLPRLQPFTPCNIPVVPNAFHAGVNAYGKGCKELAIDVFYWLKSSPSCRDYIHVLNDLGLDVTSMQVAYTYSSIRQIWEAIKKFFLEEIPKLTAQKVARQILPSSDGFSTLYGASFQDVSVLLPD